MKEPPAGYYAAATTIADIPHRVNTILMALCLPALAVVPLTIRGDGPQWLKQILTSVPAVAAYVTVVGFASVWLLYRGCRVGAHFDDHGVTIRGLLRTQRYSWPEVSHFADGYGESQGSRFWALDIVLSDGQAVTVQGPTKATRGNAKPKTLAAIGQVAGRYRIPAELTGIPPTRDGTPTSTGHHPDPGGKPYL